MGAKGGKPAGAVTIGDVAAAAKVSRSTVSRAFTRPELMKPETIERVRAEAERLGYIPNELARGLSTGRFMNLAVIVPDIANPFFPPLVRTVQRVAAASGYAVFLGDSDENPAQERLLIERLERQVDGFILVSARVDESTIRGLAQRRPVVLVNRDVEGLPRINIDANDGVAEAVFHLQSLGHSRIAYLAGPTDSWADQQRRSAIIAASQEIDIDLVVIELGRPDEGSGRDAVDRLIALDTTACVAFDDVVAQGVLIGLSHRGLSVPGDYSVVGCDDVLGATSYPPLTTISAGSTAAGKASIDVFLQLVAAGDLGLLPERTEIPTHLIVRETSGPVRETASASP